MFGKGAFLAGLRLIPDCFGAQVEWRLDARFLRDFGRAAVLVSIHMVLRRLLQQVATAPGFLGGVGNVKAVAADVIDAIRRVFAFVIKPKEILFESNLGLRVQARKSHKRKHGGIDLLFGLSSKGLTIEQAADNEEMRVPTDKSDPGVGSESDSDGHLGLEHCYSDKDREDPSGASHDSDSASIDFGVPEPPKPARHNGIESYHNTHLPGRHVLRVI